MKRLTLVKRESVPVWLLVAASVLLIGAGLAVHFRRVTEEFEITGELLYKNEKDEISVRPVGGADVQVLVGKGDVEAGGKSAFSVLMRRQFDLNSSRPGYYNPQIGTEYESLGLDPLSRMDWTWWESARLFGCSKAGSFFRASLQDPERILATSTDENGHFWLRLKRGKYFILAESRVPTFYRIDEPMSSPDKTQPTDGYAFWSIPVTVTGNTKVVSADPRCAPD